MKTLFFPDMHRRMPKAFAKALESSGYTILLPDSSFEEHIKYWKKWSKDELSSNKYLADTTNIDVISYDELLKKNPDIIVITCFEVQDDILKIYDKLNKNKTKLLHYAGNNYVPYDWDRLNNLVTTDEIIYQKAKLRNKNVLFYLPWVDFEKDYSFEGTVASLNVNSYILNYQKYFLEAYRLAKTVEEMLSKNGYKTNFIEGLDETEIPKAIQDSIATLHIKPIEGYGFSIIESMAKGRPVMLYRPFSDGKSYRYWSKDLETCLYFDSIPELQDKFLKYVENYSNIQLKCSQKIREIINIDKQNQKLQKFVDELVG
jgi:hypothetical protein